MTVAAVPTGMKAGVRILPRDVEISPSRAPLSFANSLKEKEEVTPFHFPRVEAGKRRHKNKTGIQPRWHEHKPSS